MKTVDRSQINRLSPQLHSYAYGALDVCITLEIHNELWPRVEADPAAHLHYDFSMTMQGPALLTQLRGVCIDHIAAKDALKILKTDVGKYRRIADDEARRMGAEPFRYAKGAAPSYQQISAFLFGHCKLKQTYNKQGKPSTDKECLKRVKKASKKHATFIDAVQTLRDVQKQIERMETGLSPDGRMRSAANVGGTETGRWTFNSDAYGDGTNMANNDRRVRNIYIADQGMVMINADLEQAESNIIAHVAQDENYIKAHKSGNVHVMAGYTFWPDHPKLPWSGDLKKDKVLMKKTPAWWIPQQPPAPGEDPATSVYDMSKRGQHGLNYMLTPRGLAIWLGCTVKEAEGYYDRYFSMYPGIPNYHRWIAGELELTSSLVTPMGVRRQFFGRSWDKGTIKEAVAHVPQQTCAYILDIGMYRLYRDLEPSRFQLLGQSYDSVLGQTPRPYLEPTMAAIAKALRVDVPVHGRIMTIPVEVQCGPNFRDQMDLDKFLEWEKSKR